MKRGLILVLVFCFSCREKPADKPSETAAISPGLTLDQDSGFISKKEGLAFMLANRLTDTAGVNWQEYATSETIGKYYRSAETGNYVLCLKELLPEFPSEEFLLIEVNAAKDKILKNEKYNHWNRGSCWNGKNDLLRKMGNFFVFKACGSGSGFSSTNLYLFKTVQPQDSLNYIIAELYSNSPFPRTLTSTATLKDTFLLMHYFYQEESQEGTPSGGERTKVSSNNFEVPYSWRRGNWYAPDSSMLKDPEYFFY